MGAREPECMIRAVLSQISTTRFTEPAHKRQKQTTRAASLLGMSERN